MSQRVQDPTDMLGRLSDAEWEYAWRYAESVTWGDPEPDSSGFDPKRIKPIRSRIDRAIYNRNREMFGNIADRIRR